MNGQMTQKERMVAAFGKAASYDRYSTLQQRVAERLAETITRTVHPQPRSILEVGCGTGHLTEVLSEYLPTCTILATDIAPDMVTRCREKLANRCELVAWDLMDGEHPSSCGTADLICSSMTFQWFENLASTLQRYHQLMRSEATLAFALPVRGSLLEWEQFAERHSLAAGLQPFSSSEQLQQSLVECGFSILSCTEIRFEEQFPNPLAFLRSIKGTGAATPVETYKRTPPEQLRAALQQEHNELFCCTWSILFVVAKRHESTTQQETP